MYIVLLHELGHAIAAQKLGIPVRSITLTAVGGVASISDTYMSPKQEVWITVAGPAVNVVIGLLLLPFVFPLTLSDVPNWETTDYLRFIFIINLIILIFNSVPIYPMDGGRIVKALTQLLVNNKVALFNVLGLNLVLGVLVVYFFLSKGNFIASGLITLISVVGFFTSYAKLRELLLHKGEHLEGVELLSKYNPTQLQSVLKGYLYALASETFEGISDLPHYVFSTYLLKNSEVSAIKVELQEKELYIENDSQQYFLIQYEDHFSIILGEVKGKKLVNTTRLLTFRGTDIQYDPEQFEILSKILQGMADQIRFYQLNDTTTPNKPEA